MFMRRVYHGETKTTILSIYSGGFSVRLKSTPVYIATSAIRILAVLEEVEYAESDFIPADETDG